MPIAFFNIRSKETVTAETEPQISALWASSDRSPNITQGQDFGWRLAPAVVVEMKRIKQDYARLQEIASRYRISVEDIDEKAILQYISDTTTREAAPVADDTDYSDEYNDEIRRLQLEADAERTAALERSTAPVTTTTTTEAPTTTTTTTKAK
jgi:hypothetical protein